MRPLCEHIRIEGVGIDRQLIALEKRGFTLYDIKKNGIKSTSFGYAKSNSTEIHAFLSQRGFSVTVLPPQGKAQHLKKLRENLFLICLALCALLLLSFSLRYVWHIEIRGAQSYIGEVRLFLEEEHIRSGILAEQLNLKSLSDKLTRRLPRVAWVRMSFHGVTLRIDVTQGTPMPSIETKGENGHIIAAQDGIIVKMNVYAGTPAVKEGDSVKAGDILIYGHERASNEGLTPLRARGKVLAKCYLEESAALSANSYESLRTGNKDDLCVAHMFRFSLPLRESPAYLLSEFESEYLPLGGAWLPLYLEKRTVHEVYLNPIPPDEARLKAESGRLAMQKLLLSVAENDEIIDKWLNYSMIEGGILLATATAEILADIGRFSPETPN